MAEERTPHPREVVDWSGRRYRIGEDPRALIGWPRWSVLLQAWVAMAAVGTMQYAYGAAPPARTSGKPPLGGYWLDRVISASAAARRISSGPCASGKPWPRLIAPVSRARADIFSKMVAGISR